jgi:hypothetical protein
VFTQIRYMHTPGASIERADRDDPQATQELNFRISATSKSCGQLADQAHDKEQGCT